MARYLDRDPYLTSSGPGRALGPLRSHHDVVVVGARCAGAATARLLARAGHDVVMVDRSRPSRDTSSTHSLSRGGVVQLARWGLLNRVVASGAPEIRTVTFHHDGEVATHTIKDRAGVDFVVAPRRYVLDELLANAAVAAGARLITDTVVTGLVHDADGRVTGVRSRDADGTERELTARLVIGADGVRSPVARYVDAEVTERYGPTGSCFYTYVGGVPWDGIELHVAENAFAGVFPTHNDEACVWLIRPFDDMRPVIEAGSHRTDAWLDQLDRTVPGLAGRVRGGTFGERLRGYAGLPNHVKRPYGAGWALVGDAGYHRDPITGHGITDAFRDAELVSEAADAVLRGTDEDEAMSRYESQRNAAIELTFGLTRALGAFPEPTDFLETQTRLSKALDAEALALAARPVPGYAGRRPAA
ncbi:FAD-dependent monooxygenase [Nocardioides guangzhouensis]|uniref:FAD-dependent monooxygenase n=1 Tax=Nocardioides guangzhouensis TaxID=2497878 RepID=A0A4Q4ZB37_9ACTN|nr:NAD(P)/FAD-dependent oxidoreductase [Nocardioides guangzhouensis]RYP85200.1 FAD-dependent monooxygenase [Nocardioides guangzhouensis]